MHEYNGSSVRTVCIAFITKIRVKRQNALGWMEIF